MCTRQISFTDLMHINQKKIDESYFQPHLILKGLSKFHINAQCFEVKETKDIISLKSKESCKNMHIENSIIAEAESDNEKFLHSMEINNLYDFYSDVFS